MLMELNTSDQVRTGVSSVWLVDVTGNCSGDMIGWFGDREVT